MMMATATQTPEVAEVQDPFEVEIEQQGALVLKESMAIVKIENNEQYEMVCQKTLEAAANIKKITEHLGPAKKERYALWKRLCEVETRLLAPFETVKERGSKMTGAYQYEQEQIRLRQEAEERARLQKEEEARIAKEAEQLASEGRIEEGLAHLEEKTEVIAPVVAERWVPRVAGISAPRFTYKAEVVDLKALIAAAHEGKVPVQVFGSLDPQTKVWDIESGQSFLNKQASALKEAMDYPGVKLTKTISSSTRAPR